MLCISRKNEEKNNNLLILNRMVLLGKNILTPDFQVMLMLRTKRLKSYGNYYTKLKTRNLKSY